MPHSKCVACKTRLYTAAGSDDLVGDLCPGCGSLLEPVGELAEIVGFRSIRARDCAVDDGPPGAHQRIADRVDDLFARREAILAQARLDAGRWVDEGGSCSPDGVAEAIAAHAKGESVNAASRPSHRYRCRRDLSSSGQLIRLAAQRRRLSHAFRGGASGSFSTCSGRFSKRARADRISRSSKLPGWPIRISGRRTARGAALLSVA